MPSLWGEFHYSNMQMENQIQKVAPSQFQEWGYGIFPSSNRAIGLPQYRHELNYIRNCQRDWYRECTRSVLTSLKLIPWFTSSTMNSALSGTRVGWIGDKSNPMTRAEGNSSATSKTHLPDPVPRSTWIRNCRGIQDGTYLTRGPRNWDDNVCSQQWMEHDL